MIDDELEQQMTTLVTHTHVGDNALLQALLKAYADVYAEHKHRYANRLSQQKFQALTRKEQKSVIDKTGCLPYRVYRSIEQNVKGLRQAVKTHQKNNLFLAKDKLKDKKSEFEKAQRRWHNLKKTNETQPIAKKHLNQAYRKMQGLHRAFQNRQNRVNALEKKLKDPQVSLCFGTKKAMKQRQRLPSNDKQRIERWKEDWRHHRASEIHFTGTNEEIMGNVNAHVVSKDGQYRLRIAFPESLWQHKTFKAIWKNKTYQKALKTVKKGKVPFSLKRPVRLVYDLPLEVPYHAWLLESHLDSHRPDSAQSPRPLYVALKLSKNMDKVTVNLGVRETNHKPVTSLKHGAIGVDINPDNLGLAETNAKGQLLRSWTVPMDLKGKSSDQRANIISLAVQSVVEEAQRINKSIVLEDLDFRKKKQALHKNHDKHYARMLSSFAYNQIKMAFHRKAFRALVSVKSVNPAWTSQIGNIKYHEQTNTSHESAAYVIARRGQGFNERLPKQAMKLVEKDFHFFNLEPLEPTAPVDAKGHKKRLEQWIRVLSGHSVSNLKVGLSSKIFSQDSSDGKRLMQKILLDRKKRGASCSQKVNNLMPLWFGQYNVLTVE
jgi:IS605 OrfB family transposase